jgi:hypothetical protein
MTAMVLENVALFHRFYTPPVARAGSFLREAALSLLQSLLLPRAESDDRSRAPKLTQL